MKTQHLFCKEDCIAIEDKYGRHIVYRAFRTPCLTVANESRTFSLHPSDLFYQCFYTIDLLKEMSSTDRIGYCHYQLREDLLEHFTEKVENADEKEIYMAVYVVIQAVAEWLVRLEGQRSPLVMLLLEQMDKEVILHLNPIFRHGFQCVDSDEVTMYMKTYMESDEWISDEIHAFLDAMDDESGHEVKSTLRIADGMKRLVVVVLKAIMELGWVVDVNGGRPKNIEKAVNEILCLAFGEKKKTALSQTIKPTGYTDIERSMNGIAEELANKIRSFADEKKKKR